MVLKHELSLNPPTAPIEIPHYVHKAIMAPTSPISNPPLTTETLILPLHLNPHHPSHPPSSHPQLLKKKDHLIHVKTTALFPAAMFAETPENARLRPRRDRHPGCPILCFPPRRRNPRSHSRVPSRKLSRLHYREDEVDGAKPAETRCKAFF